MQCSPQFGGGGPNQQQFFRAKPFDVDVAQGGTAVIECEVANRKGRVQWTKDGLTLGKYAHTLKGHFFGLTLTAGCHIRPDTFSWLAT